MSRIAVRIVPLLLGLSVVALGVAPGAAAGGCTIPGSHATIQAAIDDPSCALINVAAGTFNESLNITRSLDIVGAGTTSSIIDGGQLTIHIGGPTAHTVGLRDLTVTGANGTGGGGGFQIEEAAHAVSLVDVAVTGNTTTSDGGGIWLGNGATLEMRGGSIIGNQSGGQGGGIYAVDNATVKLIDVRVDDNEALGGGGIHQETGVLEISGGTVDGNQTTGSSAGIDAFDLTTGTITRTTIRSNTSGNEFGAGYLAADGALTLRHVLVDGNTADDQNGGLGAEAVQLTIENSSVTNNASEDGLGGGLYLTEVAGSMPIIITNTTVSGNRSTIGGGGIFVRESLVATNLTVTNNIADADGSGDGDGGAILVQGEAGEEVILRNSILFGNTDGSPGAEAPECAGPVTSGGSNIIGTLAGCAMTPQASDRIGVDPELGPLADNGGGTLTHPLRKGSPAINQADPSFAPQADQRGAPRKDPDIGAYERVLCGKVLVNRVGTEGKDKLRGTNKADGILGLGGKDTLTGKGGKDGLCGGGGKDKLKGGGGKDRMKGQGGKDVCIGGGGTDKAVCEKETKI